MFYLYVLKNPNSAKLYYGLSSNFKAAFRSASEDAETCWMEVSLLRSVSK